MKSNSFSISARLAPHKANVKYLLKHKWHVLRAGLKLNVPLWRLVVHDWSKLTPIEWFAYTAFFFGKKPSDHNMHVPGEKPTSPPIEKRTEGNVVTATLVTADKPNLNDDLFPKEVLDKAVNKFDDQQRIAQRFDIAWLHHIHLNPHHWQYWVLRQDVGEIKCLEMPIHFVREMIADWVGAGFAQGKTSRDAVQVWYSRNKDKIQLHQRTRELVEALIKVYVHS